MRNILLVLVIAVLTSCSATTPVPDKSLKKAAVQHVYYSSAGASYVQDSTVEIKYIDTMYHIGDMIELTARDGPTEYRVIRD